MNNEVTDTLNTIIDMGFDAVILIVSALLTAIVKKVYDYLGLKNDEKLRLQLEEQFRNIIIDVEKTMTYADGTEKKDVALDMVKNYSWSIIKKLGLSDDDKALELILEKLHSELQERLTKTFGKNTMSGREQVSVQPVLESSIPEGDFDEELYMSGRYAN